MAAALLLVPALGGCNVLFGVDPHAGIDAGASVPADAPPPPPAWHLVSAGLTHTCGIDDATRALWCWGQNDRGQLGDGSRRDRNRPDRVFVSVPRTWIAVAAGGTHTCAIEEGGALWCWGNNDRGQLGDGSRNGTVVPVRVGEDQPWQVLAAGDASTCAIDGNGALACWGEGTSFRLGTGDSLDHTSPALVVSTVTRWSDVAIYRDHACGLGDGDVWCWGNNDFGQVTGVPTPADPTEEPVMVMAGASDVDVGGSHTCAVGAPSGVLRCWGSDGSGQFGDGDVVSGPGPVDNDSAGAFVQVDTAFGSTCGIRMDGALLCWGENYYGVIGLGEDLIHPLPTVIAPGTRWKQVTTQVHHSCALTEAGALWCTGRDQVGQLGLGTGGPVRRPVAVTATGGELIAVGRASACEVRAGQAWCWGDNQYGTVGAPLGVLAVQAPARVPGTASVNAITVGDSHTCAARTGQAPLCWGFGGEYALGDSGMATTATPTGVVGPSVSHGHRRLATLVRAGRRRGLVLGPQRHLPGRRKRGDRDDADPAARPPGGAGAELPGAATPVWCRTTPTKRSCAGAPTPSASSGPDRTGTSARITSAGPRVLVTAGYDHTCSVDDAGEAFCWGDNTYGQAGGATVGGVVLSPTNMVTRPTGVTSWRRIATGARHTCAIADTDQLYCWGSNAVGQLGHGGGDEATVTPTQVLHPQGSTWKRVAAGADTTCAHDASDRLWCWGANYYGQVGNSMTWRTAWTEVAP